MPSISPYSQSVPSTLDVAYGQNPWAEMTENKRTWYDPLLRYMFDQERVYSQFTTYAINLREVRTEEMIITTLLNSHTNYNAIGLRDIWLPSGRTNSKSQRITFKSYGAAFQYHKVEPMITYWESQGRSADAVAPILQSQLMRNMMEQLEYLSRSAFLTLPYKIYGGSATSFNTIDSTSSMATDILDQIQLGMQERGAAGAVNPTGQGLSLVCITSPGVIYDIRRQSDPKLWYAPKLYSDAAGLLSQYEVGMISGVRFIVNPRAVLKNCGAKVIQANVSAAVQAGDGAPDPTTTQVDSVFYVGQQGVTHYIQLASGTDMSKFAVNDEVTLHVNRTSDFGVTNGVDYRDGQAETHRIVSIDAGSYRLTFAEPVWQDFTTDLGGTVYGYVTKARHVHTASFIGGPNAIAVGVSEAPRIYNPPTIDHRMAMRTFSWDAYLGYNHYNPYVVENWFGSASYKGFGTSISVDQ